MKSWQPITVFLTLLAVLIALFTLFSYTNNSEAKILSFEDCVAAGNPILESYPEQCITEGGKHFSRKLSVREQMYIDTGEYPAKGYCASSEECVTDGCSSQICRSVYDESVVTTCEVTNSKRDESYKCNCITSKCQWIKYPAN